MHIRYSSGIEETDNKSAAFLESLSCVYAFRIINYITSKSRVKFRENAQKPSWENLTKFWVHERVRGLAWDLHCAQYWQDSTNTNLYRLRRSRPMHVQCTCILCTPSNKLFSMVGASFGCNFFLIDYSLATEKNVYWPCMCNVRVHLCVALFKFYCMWCNFFVSMILGILLHHPGFFYSRTYYIQLHRLNGEKRHQYYNYYLNEQEQEK